MSAESIAVAEIHAARRRITGAVRRTPLDRSGRLGERVGAEVRLKLECWQRTRSFKIRGAYNAVAALDDAARARGLVAASAGNHGQGVALAASELGARAAVFVPADAPATKQERIEALGAELIRVQGGYDDAEAAAARYAEARGATFVHAFDDPAVVAGQGTLGLEILAQMPEVRTVVVPVGGGGLVAGIGTALKDASDGRIRIVGVQSEATAAMHAALAAGRPVDLEFGPTLADGLSGAVSEVSYRRARGVIDEMRLVPETAIRDAIRFLFRCDGVVAEGSGAVGVAALLGGHVEVDGPTAVVVSGGNIDAARLGSILLDA